MQMVTIVWFLILTLLLSLPMVSSRAVHGTTVGKIMERSTELQKIYRILTVTIMTVATLMESRTLGATPRFFSFFFFMAD